MNNEPLLPRKRARRTGGYAVRAEATAREILLQTGSLPSQRELRTMVGGGSTRDIVAALQYARAQSQSQSLSQSHRPSVAINRDHATDANVDKAILQQRIAELVAENAELRSLEAQNEERVRGLERHLLMETARLRDQLIAEAAVRNQSQSHNQQDSRALFRVGKSIIIKPDVEDGILD